MGVSEIPLPAATGISIASQLLEICFEIGNKGDILLKHLFEFLLDLFDTRVVAVSDRVSGSEVHGSWRRGVVQRFGEIVAISSITCINSQVVSAEENNKLSLG